MRDTNSSHQESIRSLPSHYWSGNISFSYGPPALNIKGLIRLLKKVEISTTSDQKGKKRAADSSSSPGRKHAKRHKPGSTSQSFESSEDSSDDDEGGDFDHRRGDVDDDKILESKHFDESYDNLDVTMEEEDVDDEALDIEHLDRSFDIYGFNDKGFDRGGYHIDTSRNCEGDFRGAEYPTFDATFDPDGDEDLDSESTPVLHHVAEIQYTNAIPTDEDHADNSSAAKRGWLKTEKQLSRVLRALCPTVDDIRTIDLGKFYFREYHGRLFGMAILLRNEEIFGYGDDEDDEALFIVPRFNHEIEIDCDALDYHAHPNPQDIFFVCETLRSAGRARIKGNLKLHLLPAGAYDESANELPFRLHLDITVSLIHSIIFQPFPNRGSKKDKAHLEEAQRSFFTFIFPPNQSPISTDAVNIPFFYSILSPAPLLATSLAEEAAQPEQLLPTLLPFQRRSVAWLLRREGKTISAGGEITSISQTSATVPLFWDEVAISGQTWYINRLNGMLTDHPPDDWFVQGGILAEEPGLGKTLETIALILLNPAPVERNPTVTRWDSEAKLDVKEIKTTLIVTPPALASQWADELKLHAPSLKVLVYSGWSTIKVPLTQQDAAEEIERRRTESSKALDDIKSSPSRRNAGKAQMIDELSTEHNSNGEVLDWCQYINNFDVCITTYACLRQDFNVAKAAVQRPRREDVVYGSEERKRSPLVMCEWYRVVMDEVQMVSGRTEDMVSLIPRLSSFAVSGTPARAQVADLLHVLKFLRVEHTIGGTPMWHRLLKPGFAGHFAAFFQKYAIRTTKSTVQTELTIPQQTRYLVGIKMGRVERQVYDQALEAALQDLGLDSQGVAGSDGWKVDGAILRRWVRMLRGICTHPQVGQFDRLFRNSTLKSMDDVLEAMKDQNWRTILDDSKSKVQSLIRLAQLEQRNEGDNNRYQHALETLLVAEKDIKKLIDEISAAMIAHRAKGDSLVSSKEVKGASNEGNGKGKERQMSAPHLAEDPELNDDTPTAAEKAHGIKARALQQRLRECRVTLHQVMFLLGDVYHVLGASHAASEDASYQAAEVIRRDLLKATEDSANQAIDQLIKEAASVGQVEKALLIPSSYLKQGDYPVKPTKKKEKENEDLTTSDLIDEANAIIEEQLTEQTILLRTWRERLYTLLTQRLSPSDSNADGEEYARTLETQGEAEAYLQNYAHLLADRKEVLLNERTLLAAHDVREKKLRVTQAANRATTALQAELFETLDDVELQPQDEVLFEDLSLARKELMGQGRAIKSVIVDLNTRAGRIHKEKDPEKAFIKETVVVLRSLVKEQTELMDRLDSDLAQLRKCFNERILYFRQLQEISDSVAEVTWPDSTLADALQACRTDQTELEAKINTSRARQRFLHHLAKNDGMNEEDETCILCRCDFSRGFITQCAHVFCEGCMKAWLARHNRTCPVCRTAIIIDQIQRFTVNDKTNPPTTKPNNNNPPPRTHRKIEYNMIDAELFYKIQDVESDGSYGSKIQALVRHILYLQDTDPGAKSIVFSAWVDSLHIVEHALVLNGIRCLRIDQNSKGENAAKRFRTDPDILVLLLHGEKENAGLNVTCASRVFLLESVVHHGFEIQAIARIDRMGQTKPTEVYCYYTEDTVEKNILDLAARQGLSLYTKENFRGTVDISSFAAEIEKKVVDSPSKKHKVQKGDFIFKIDDMLAILFPHLYEETVYLVPQEDVAMEDLPPTSDRDIPWDPQAGSSRGHYANAVAGPSRLT